MTRKIITDKKIEDKYKMFKDYFDSKYKNKLIPNYLMLKNSPIGTMEHSMEVFFDKNGGKSQYCEFLNINGYHTSNIVYIDTNKKAVKSFNEFAFACFCHYNNIEYKYEEIRIKNRLPDFYIPIIDKYFEIVGFKNNKHINKFSRTKHYFDNLEKKKKIFLKENIFIEYLEIKNNPMLDIHENLSKYFNNLKIPDITYYFQNYCISGDNYIENLKQILIKYQNNEISHFEVSKKYTAYFNYIIKNYSSIENAIKELLNIDDHIIKRKVSMKYWIIHENCIKYLDLMKEKHGILPNKRCAIANKEFMGLASIYRYYNENEFKINGIFHKYVDFYNDKNKIIKKVIQVSTNIIFDSINMAFYSTNFKYSYNEFLCNLNTNPLFDFKYISNNRFSNKIQNTITGEIYNSIVECAEKESLCKDALGRYLANVKIRNKIIKSKFNYLKPLTYKGKQLD